MIRNDTSGHFQAALHMGDTEERMKVLSSCCQNSLVYITAAKASPIDKAIVLAGAISGDEANPVGHVEQL